MTYTDLLPNISQKLMPLSTIVVALIAKYTVNHILIHINVKYTPEAPRQTTSTTGKRFVRKKEVSK